MKTSDQMRESNSEQQAKMEREIVATKLGVVFTFVGDYTVAWDRIRNEADLLSWIYHLSGKEWFTRERLTRFLELVAAKKAMNLHCAP